MSVTRSRTMARATSLLFLMAMVLSSVVMVKPAQAAPGVIDGPTPGTNMIMEGNCLKVGVKSNGTLGVGHQTRPGIQYDNNCTGTFNDSYDFLAPGDPFEFVTVVKDSTILSYNNSNWYPAAGWDGAATKSISNKAGVAYRGTTVDNRVVTHVTDTTNDIKMENDIRFDNEDRIIEITTYITNTGASAISEMYIGRGIDSDAVVSGGDSSATNNARGYSIVSGRFLVFSETTSSKAVMGYYTAQDTPANMTNTGISGDWSENPSVYFTAPDDGNGDNTIGIVRKFENVAAGATVSFSYAYIFGPSAYAALDAAVVKGAAGGTPGRVPGCTVTADEPCTLEDVGSAVMTNTPRPRTATRTRTVVPATATNTLTPSNTATATNTFTPTNTMTPTPHPFAIKDVAVGASFTLGVLHNGTLVTWGFNRAGQASLPRWMATKLVDQVETGSNYAIALGTDGRVYGWGANDFGQMTIPTQALSGVRSISASLGHVMAIKTNGDLVIWGRNDFKQREAPLTARKGLSAVGAGHSHSLAVKGGKVIAWGRNTWGQTNVPRTLTNVIAVSGGFDHSLALRSNGTVVCWGRNNENQCKIPNGLKDVIAISAGVGYSLALTRDGMVYGWGRGNYGQAAVPAGLGKAGAISAGYVNSVIGMRDASVVAFGDSSLGALVSRTPTVTP
jgi:hypothetical protein